MTNFGPLLNVFLTNKSRISNDINIFENDEEQITDEKELVDPFNENYTKLKSPQVDK